jgi:outer membrane lipoprotein LolB
VATLFDWLAGIPSVATGWQADLSGRAEGRLRARRLTAPAADLRIVLHTP